MITYDSIKINCTAIRTAIEEVTHGDINKVVNKLLKLVNISGLSAENVGNAKEYYREAQLLQMNNVLDDKPEFGQAMMSEFVKAKCGQAEGLLDEAKYLQNSLGNSIDGLRTVISLHKSEMENQL